LTAFDQPTELPLLWDTTDQPSAFDPADWFRYCEAINGRPPPRLPAIGLQTVMPAHLELAIEWFGAEVDDFTLADHPVATFRFDGTPVALGLSAKGSYAAGGLDELIALGARRVIFLGGAASLVPGLPVDSLFVPTKALRDDGVSLHYEPPSRYCFPSPDLLGSLQEAVRAAGLRLHTGPIWTTTAHFRQSIPRLHAFREEGCRAVNNEAAAAFSVGRHRGVAVAALVMIGDTLADDRFEVPEGHAKLYGPTDVGTMLEVALRAVTAKQQIPAENPTWPAPGRPPLQAPDEGFR
jgi:purine-nucleoside phosphorylase